jgi:hypothetical protein
MLKIITLLSLITTSIISFAHDGEEHVIPGNVQVKNLGAQIKGNEDYLLELVYSDKNIKIYPFTIEQKAIAPSAIKLSAKIELPRKKIVPIELKASGDHYSASFDPGTAHRFTVLVQLPGEHKDILKYTIEKK